MTKNEFNEAIRKLVELRDTNLDSEEYDKMFYVKFFEYLGQDHEFGKLMFMLFWTMIHGVEQFQEDFLKDWDNPGFQEFLGVADEWGWQWGEFISDSVHDFVTQINEKDNKD